MAVLAGEPHLRSGIPPGLIPGYPILIAAVAVGYGVVVGGWPFFAASGVILASLLIAFGSKGYLNLRQQLAGLDRIALGLASFLLAALISLGKAGLLRRWLPKSRFHRPEVQTVSADPGP